MRFRLLLVISFIAGRADAQATVSGVVRDSIAGGTLAGAIVQLVATGDPAQFDRSATSDALGRFTFSGVPNGAYTLGFIHAMLDSLGLEPIARGIAVSGEQTVRADLAVPSPSRLRAAVCGSQQVDSNAVVIGFVRDARVGAPVGSAAVAAQWLELELTAEGVSRSRLGVDVVTADNGWFALCNVPSGGTISLMAGRGADSSGLIEVRMPASGFARRELYLGAVQHLVRISGTVVSSVGKRPIAGAIVSIGEGSMARADDRGDWTLWDVPAGSRMLDVRAVGYYPDRRAVHVVSNPAPLRVELPTLRSVLDTVTVRATRLNDRNMKGFEERRRGSGVGRFMTAEVIAQRNAQQTSDLFRMMPSTYLYLDNVLMRGPFGPCSPALYIDGAQVNSGARGLLTGDIDIWARPDEIAGIEIYPANQGPVQFQRGLGGCGSIVVWMKPLKVNANPPSFEFRLLQGVVIAAVMLLVAALIDRREQ